MRGIITVCDILKNRKKDNSVIQKKNLGKKKNVQNNGSPLNKKIIHHDKLSQQKLDFLMTIPLTISISMKLNSLMTIPLTISIFVMEIDIVKKKWF